MSTVVVSNVHFDSLGNTRIHIEGANLSFYDKDRNILSVNSQYFTISNSTTSASLGTQLTSAEPLPIGTYIISALTPNSSYIETNKFYSRTTYSSLFSVLGTQNISDAEFRTVFTDNSTDTAGFATVAYGNSAIVAAGSRYNQDLFQSYPLLYSSTDDGTTWAARTDPFSGNAGTYRSSIFKDGLFIVVGYSSTSSGRIITSTDSINWTSRTSVSGNNNAIVHGNGTFIIGATGTTTSFQTSSNGTTWTARTGANSSGCLGLAYGNGVFVSVGPNGAIQTSSDNGTTWTNRTSPTTSNLYSVAYGDGVFVAGGDSGYTRSTDNGVTWSNSSLIYGAHSINLVYYTNSKFYAHGTIVASSSNGISWEPLTMTYMASVSVNPGANSLAASLVNRIYRSSQNTTNFYVPSSPFTSGLSFAKDYIRAT